MSHVRTRQPIDTARWPVDRVTCGEPLSATGAASSRDAVERAAVLRPDAPAVRDDRQALDYAGLAAAARRFGSWLREQGVGPGDRIVVRADSSVDVVVVLHGALRSGVAVAPLHPQARHFQVVPMIDDAEPRLVLAHTHEVSVLAGMTGARVLALPDAVAGSRRLPDPGPDGVRVATAGDGPALLLYTSGSSSTPKAVACPAGQVDAALTAIRRRLAYQPGDIVFCRIPLAFDYGLYQVLLCADAAAELVLADGGSDSGLLGRIRSSGTTVLPLVPTLARMLVALASRGTTAPAVRLLTSTGEHLAHHDQLGLLDAFPHARLSLMYGLTECKRVSIATPTRDGLPADAVGRPVPGSRVAVLDPDGRPLPRGRTGEIVTAGANVATGYWRAPGPTAERFTTCSTTGDRVLFTGDHGRLTEDGEIVVTGRADDLFKSSGVRVSAREIESAAIDVDGVRAAVVVPPRDGRPGRLWVEATIPAERVLDELRLRLEPAKVPPSCRVVDVLPVTANGKLDRVALRTRTEEEAC